MFGVAKLEIIGRAAKERRRVDMAGFVTFMGIMAIAVIVSFALAAMFYGVYCLVKRHNCQCIYCKPVKSVSAEGGK